MKKILILFLLLFIAVPAYATIYCVKPDGNCAAASKANAAVASAAACTAVDSSANVLSMATFNAATFSAGDTVYFSNKDTTLTDSSYNTTMTIPSSGSAGNVITYAGIADGTGGVYPTLKSPATSTNMINASKSYITVSGFNIASSASSSAVLAITMIGTVSNITINNIDIKGVWQYGIAGTAAQTYVSLSDIVIHEGITTGAVYCNSATATNWTIDNVDLSGDGVTSATYGYYFKGVTGVSMSNCDAENFVIATSSLYAQNITGLTLTDNTLIKGTASAIAGSSIKTSTGVVINGLTIDEPKGGGITVTGPVDSLTVTDVEIYDVQTSVPFYMTTVTAYAIDNLYIDGTATAQAGCKVTDSSGTITNSTFRNSLAQGLLIEGAGVSTVTSSIAEYNHGDGFDAGDTVGDTCTVTWDKIIARYNGDSGVDGSGDGISCHTGTTCYITRYLGYGNTRSCIAPSLGCNGYMYSSSCNINEDATPGPGSAADYAVYMPGAVATTFDFKNNIFAGNVIAISVADASGVTFDYNLYDATSTWKWAGTTYTAAQWANYKAASGQDAHSVVGDPKFKSSSDLRLARGSSGIDIGTNLCTGVDTPFVGCTGAGTGTWKDYYNNDVPYGKAPDGGAIEYYPVAVKR